MIDDKTFKTLGVSAGILVVLSAWVGSRQPIVEFEFRAGQLLVDDIDPGAIDAIEVAHAGETVTMKRGGSGFLIESLRNYGASTKEVNNLIRQVLGIRCAARVSDDAASHADLRVVEGGEDTTTVRFLDQDGKPLIGVALADAEEGQQYARLLGADETFRVEDFVTLRSKGLDFVDKQLLNVARDQIVRVDVAPAESAPYAVTGTEDGKSELQGVPEGKKVKGTEPDSVFGAATFLNFTDFKSQTEAGELQFANTYAVKTKDEEVYVLSLAQDGEDWWARVEGRYTGPEKFSVPKLAPDATEEQKQANAEVLKRNEALADASKRVQAFQDRHQGWIYQLSSWKAQSMTKKLDDLVEDDDGKPSEVTASHILIPFQGAQNAAADVTRTQEEAKALAEELRTKAVADPDSFASLAAENSSCPSKEKGGDLGEFTFDKMTKPFSEAAFALEVGGISDVVETEFGYHVILRTK